MLFFCAYENFGVLKKSNPLTDTFVDVAATIFDCGIVCNAIYNAI